MRVLMSKLWRGEVSLAKTYWLYGTVIPILFAVLIIVPLFIIESVFFVYLLYAYSLPYGSFMMVAIWRSSGNYNGSKIWAFLARLTCIFISFKLLRNIMGLILSDSSTLFLE